MSAAMMGVVPGTLPLDDRGLPAQLHGAGINRVGDRWYAWGEDKSEGANFLAIVVYSTVDFLHWRFEGEALKRGERELGPRRIVERPKVLQRPDGKWILFVHIDDPEYREARVGFAIADSPAGPFSYVGSERPLGNLSRDIGVFQEDGVGFLLSEDRDNGLQIYRLAADYLSVEAAVVTLRQQARPELGYESPALVRHDGIYYLFGSDLTYWDLNDNMVASATSLEGPWSDWALFAPEGTATYGSQVSTIVSLPGGRHVYVGDRWQQHDLHGSPLVMLPIQLKDGRASMSWRDQWQPAEVNLPLPNENSGASEHS